MSLNGKKAKGFFKRKLQERREAKAAYKKAYRSERKRVIVKSQRSRIAAAKEQARLKAKHGFFTPERKAKISSYAAKAREFAKEQAKRQARADKKSKRQSPFSGMGLKF